MPWYLLYPLWWLEDIFVRQWMVSEGYKERRWLIRLAFVEKEIARMEKGGDPFFQTPENQERLREAMLEIQKVRPRVINNLHFLE